MVPQKPLFVFKDGSYNFVRQGAEGLSRLQTPAENHKTSQSGINPSTTSEIQCYDWTTLLNNFSSSEEDKDSQRKFCIVIFPDSGDREEEEKGHLLIWCCHRKMQSARELSQRGEGYSEGKEVFLCCNYLCEADLLPVSCGQCVSGSIRT